MTARAARLRFGALVRDARWAAGVTLEQLAARLLCSVPYLADVELGRRAPFSMARLESAAAFLGADPVPLAEAWVEARGVRLRADLSDLHREVGRALAEAWADLTPEQLGALREVAERALVRRRSA